MYPVIFILKVLFVKAKVPIIKLTFTQIQCNSSVLIMFIGNTFIRLIKNYGTKSF